MKIYLVGLPGSGKTTMGKKIAKALDLNFIDLDEEIVNKAALPIKKIFEDKGEEYFRKLESELLREITENRTEFLMSTGGGAPCFHSNMDYINSNGASIFLNLSYEKIASRLKPNKIDKRPLFSGMNQENASEELKKKFHHRMEFYKRAKLEFEDDQLQVETIVAEIKNIFRM